MTIKKKTGGPGGNWCKQVTLLFEQDLLTGGRKFKAAFTSVQSAKMYRKKMFHNEVVNSGTDFQTMYPIEKVSVKYYEDIPDDFVKDRYDKPI